MGRERGRSARWRFLVVTAMVSAAIVLARAVDRPPAPPPAPSSGHVVFVDTAGWYVRTPDEVAAVTPFDLSLDALPASLPLFLGHWQGAERPHDPAVDRWLRRPDVAIERTYTRPDGETVWLSAFGSRGPRSFHLFEHTPEGCYPLGGWRIERIDIARLPLGPLPLAVNRGVAAGASGRLVFAHFYVWDSPARDTTRGVLSVRLAAPVRRDDATTMAALTGDFLPRLFSTTLGWARF